MVSLVFCLIIFIIAICIYYNSYKKFVSNKKAIPGPIGLPIFGYLPFLSSKPHIKLQQLGKKYGNVFKIQMGRINVVILNDFSSISEAFRKDEFLGRPNNVVFNVLMDLQGLGTLSGAEWKEQKRFTMHQLRNLGFGKTSMEEHIKNEMIELIDRISKLDGQPIDVRPLLASSTSSNISALVFGKRFDYNDPNRTILDNAVHRAVTRLGQTGFITFFPVLAKFCAHFGLMGLSEVKQDFLTVNKYIQQQIEEHENTLCETKLRDYIDCFLMQMKRNDSKQSTFTKKMLAGNVQGFFAAGSETVKTTMEWAVLIMAGHQCVQQTVHNEIDSVCGRDSFPKWSDRHRMVYTQAVINEIHRWKTISPLNLIRLTTGKTSVQNFEIEANTHVIANLWSVHHDTQYWRDPHIFNPNRFLTDDGTQLIKYDTFIPFSIGKRSCPGETFAQTEVFLCLTSLLQNFKILADKHVHFGEEIGLISKPKYPVVVKFEKRV